jgi:hypothetical protein
MNAWEHRNGQLMHRPLKHGSVRGLGCSVGVNKTRLPKNSYFSTFYTPNERYTLMLFRTHMCHFHSYLLKGKSLKFEGICGMPRDKNKSLHGLLVRNWAKRNQLPAGPNIFSHFCRKFPVMFFPTGKFLLFTSLNLTSFRSAPSLVDEAGRICEMIQIISLFDRICAVTDLFGPSGLSRCNLNPWDFHPYGLWPVRLM